MERVALLLHANEVDRWLDRRERRPRVGKRAGAVQGRGGLQSPLQWQMEQEAKLMGVDDDDFEAVERADFQVEVIAL